MRVMVDEDVCIGSGQCEQICPEVFTVEVVARVRMPDPDESFRDAVTEAAEACPTQAITIDH